MLVIKSFIEFHFIMNDNKDFVKKFLSMNYKFGFMSK
jgi:hypothetical protein